MHSERTTLTLTRLVLIAAASIAILIWSRPAGSGIFSNWRGAPAGDTAMLRGEAVVLPHQPATGALLITIDAALYSGERAELEAELHQALAYVSGRFGGTLAAPLQVQLVHTAGCSLSGIAYTDIRSVRVQSCDAIGRGRAIAILAHEYVHQLQHDRYGAAHLGADLILAEGLATWAAGSYWLGGQPDFRAFVRSQRQRGASYPLATHYSGLGIDAMNTLYYQWAGFVEFLLDTRGREAFDRLYVSGGGAPGSADYLGVYGVPLEALEQEWIAWLEQPS
ncbi:MAG TPA: hypothetical protein PKA05_21180 [Roseiflexaceae bacterium]|nr:hypothetical protein [Roseiflexaceae bacterium]HMP42903.1 hypothetical protein [Roseiflexaceae bacterium]